jgi:hypothetical protein
MSYKNIETLIKLSGKGRLFIIIAINIHVNLRNKFHVKVQKFYLKLLDLFLEILLK